MLCVRALISLPENLLIFRKADFWGGARKTIATPIHVTQ